MTDQLELAEKMGFAQMTPVEVCEVLEIAESAMAGDLLRAYKKGRLLGKMNVQTSIYEMARQGTAPAQKQYMDLAGIAELYEVEDDADPPEE